MNIGEATLSKLFCFHFGKGSTLKGKERFSVKKLLTSPGPCQAEKCLLTCAKSEDPADP